jgi:predicted nucleic acid-binding protein
MNVAIAPTVGDHQHDESASPAVCGRRLGLAASGIAGGAVYDALVGACALEHGVVLATRDRRALGSYRALEVRVEVLG